MPRPRTNGKRNRERSGRRVIDRWEWVWRSKSGKRYAAVVATLSDRGVVNVQTRRPHLVPAAGRMEAAERIADFLAGCPGMKPLPNHEQRYCLIWGPR